ncbi:hypothetical protein JCM3770_006123 [Rhodotorula araucariae]
MWSKVAKLASPAARKPPSTPAPQPPSPADAPRLFAELEAVLTAGAELAGPRRESVARLLAQLLGALKAGASEVASAQPLDEGTEHLLRENSLATLVGLVERDCAVREELVRWYGRAIVDLDEAWLGHSAVNKPLVRLLRRCVEEDGGLGRTEERAVVQVMCVVAERIKTRPELLAIFFREKAPRAGPKAVPDSIAAALNRPSPLNTLPEPPASPTLSQATMSEASTSFAVSQTSSASPRRRAEHDFLLFSYLLRFIHREGEVGDSAREGVLSLVDVALGYPALYNPSLSMHRTASSSTISPASVLLAPPAPPTAAREAVLAFAEYLLDSDFADVLGAGLGALYGLLPTKLVVRAEAATAVSAVADESQRAGGMVLGGMGPLHDEADAEAVVRQREEEELRLRAEGYGLTGTAEFREGLDGFLKLVEFAQDVLRRSTDGPARDPEQEDSADARQQHLVMGALTGAILTTVRDLFLQSVLYPSILECSETDGSAVAVLTYLDAMLGVVQEGSQLEAAIMSYLLAEEDVADPARPPHHPRRAHDSSSSSPRHLAKLKGHKSSALLLVERTTPAQHTSEYYTSLGRFSLRDLLLSHINSPSPPTAAAALKLLQTLLVQHDRWSLALLDPVLDEAATSFPIVLRAPALSLEDDESDDGDTPFTYPTPLRDDESDSDEFVYPSSTAPSTPRTTRPSAFTKTPVAALRPLLGLPLPSTPSVSLHLDSLDTLLSLVGAIDPSYRRMRAMGGGSEMVTTGFANYLRDAEASLAGAAGFRRGLSVSPDEAREAAMPPVEPRRRNTLFGGGAQALTARDFATAKTGYRHKLKPSAQLLALLLESLAGFFSHSPDVNLTLTAVLAALAVYPYRSLEGWLLPVVKTQKAAVPLPSPRAGLADSSSRSDDGDDRSDDYGVDERSRHAGLLSLHPSSPFSASSADPPPSATRAALATSESLLSILDALAQSIEQYRRAIPRFDEYLSERRQGLFFAENLADALEGEDLGAALEENTFAAPQPSVPSPPVEPVAAPKRSPGLGFGGFFSPRRPASHRRAPSTPPSAYQTPTKPLHRPSQLRRSVSDESLAPLSPSPRGLGLAPPQPQVRTPGPVSPFAAHYQQTGAITVIPVVVSTPAAAARFDHGEDVDPDADGQDGAGPGDSPTRRLSNRPTAPRPPSPSARSSASSTLQPMPAKRAPPVARAVSLSTVLDNVIVLEEFVKELAAIVYVRRAVGIDAVRFVD